VGPTFIDKLKAQADSTMAKAAESIVSFKN